MAGQQENYQLYKRYVKNIALIYNQRKDIRTYVELMLSISVVVIFGMFAIRPTFVTIVELRQEILTKERNLELLNKKIDDLDRAQEVKIQFQRQLALLNTAVPDGPLPAVYARQIEGIAKRHNSELRSLSAEQVTILGSKISTTNDENVDPEITDRYPTQADSVVYSFSIAGTYENIIELVVDLEKLRRPIFIDDMSLSLSNDEEDSNIVILSVSGRVPYLIENEKER